MRSSSFRLLIEKEGLLWMRKVNTGSGGKNRTKLSELAYMEIKDFFFLEEQNTTGTSGL